MNRPRPVPPFEPVKNGSKIRSASGCCDAGAAVDDLEERPLRGARCAPVRSSTGASLSSRRPYLSAFSHRFHSIWCRCEGSTRTSRSAARPSRRIARSSTSRSGGTRARKSASHAFSSMRSGRVVSRRDSCSTLLMMVLTRSPLLVMMSVRRRSWRRQLGRLRQQLRGMAHRADRVADLVRDAGAEPAERRELRLLHALDDQRGVLEEYQRRPLAAAVERDEMRLDQAAAVGGEHGQRAELPVVGAPAPRVQQVQQARRDLAERRALPDARSLQQQRGRLVDQADRVVRIHDQDALAQVLHDELVQLGEVGDVDLALAHALFALAQVARQRRDAERHDEYQRADDAGGGEVARVALRSQRRERLLYEYGERGDRSEHQGQAWPHARTPSRRSAAPAAMRGRWSCRRSRRSAQRSRSRRCTGPRYVWMLTSGQRRLTDAIDSSPYAKYAATAPTNSAG